MLKRSTQTSPFLSLYVCLQRSCGLTKSYRGNVTEVLVVLVDGQLIVACYTSPHPLHVVSKDVTKKILCMNLFLYKLLLDLYSFVRPSLQAKYDWFSTSDHNSYSSNSVKRFVKAPLVDTPWHSVETGEVTACTCSLGL